MAVLSASAGLAYATKGNILWPGSSGEATTVQNNAIARLNDDLRSAPGGAAPNVDQGDLIVVATGDAAGSLNVRLDH